MLMSKYRMAVGPAIVSRDLFFDIMEAYLKSDPNASDVTVIPDAFLLMHVVNI